MHWRSVHLLAVLGALGLGCSSNPPAPAAPSEPASAQPAAEALPEGVRAVPLAAPSGGVGFTLQPNSETGLAFTNALTDEHNRKYLYNGSGISVGDVDGNGLPDLFLTALDSPSRLYLQDEPWRFRDATESSGIGLFEAWSSGSALVDVDGDADLDLYVCNLGTPDRLYLNAGDGTFTDGTDAAGLGFAGASVYPAFADIDNDGDLDLYLLTNRVFSAGEEAHNAKVRLVNGKPTVHPDFVEHYTMILGRFSEAGQADHLYRNDGGRFVEITDEAGIAGYDMGLSATWWDYDQDGFVDLYVANDMKTPDHLYRNRGDGTFAEVTAEVFPHTAWFSMGVDAGDLDNDGRPDLMVGDMSATNHYKAKTTMGQMGDAVWFLTGVDPPQYMRNALLVNTGTGRFLEAARLAGLASTDWTWAIRFADLDNDGWQDVFVTNGHARNANDGDVEVQTKQLIKAGKREEAKQLGFQLPPLAETNRAFRNRGDLAFDNVSAEWGLDHQGISHGAAVADLDRDGDLDIVTNNLGAELTAWRNEGGAGHRIQVVLQGEASARNGRGARISVEGPTGTQYREVQQSHGYLSSDEALVQFGLGEETAVESLTVRWPSGHVQRFEGLPADRRFTISEPAGPGPGPAVEEAAPTWFAEAPPLPFAHAEADFDDYEQEPLLPARQSRMGPGLAAQDFDGDGRDDLFVGGAARQAGALLSSVAGGFAAVEGPWAKDLNREDMATLVFDADGDGDSDLYVVGGGVETTAGSPLLRDALYLRDGETWTRAEAARLPALKASGGPVVSADVDGDGDLDLFVGGRTVPGSYPTPEASVLLVQSRGRFGVKQRFEDVGAVHGARFADLDGDGDPDLVLATEWGPVRVLMNEDGTFVDRSDVAGTADKTGWWHGVEAGDLDGDGDLDLVATNNGLNSKYHASAEHPATLLVSDFDGDGTTDLVEADWEGDTFYPVRGLSCSSTAMPRIKDDFPTFDTFARATIDDLYGDHGLDEAARYEANWFQHTAFLNDGTGRFEARPLPRRAQISVGWGVALTDFDADGHLDLAMAQNWFSPEPETGKWDGGLGQILRGRGDGTFEPVEPARSGVVVPGDAVAAVIGDFDADGHPDLAISQNNDRPRAFFNRRAGRHLRVVLEGAESNPQALGAFVTLGTDAGRTMHADVAAGGGYLGQSARGVWFGLPGSEQPTRIEVRWPDGSKTSHTELPSEGTVRLRPTSS